MGPQRFRTNAASSTFRNRLVRNRRTFRNRLRPSRRNAAVGLEPLHLIPRRYPRPLSDDENHGEFLDYLMERVPRNSLGQSIPLHGVPQNLMDDAFETRAFLNDLVIRPYHPRVALFHQRNVTNRARAARLGRRRVTPTPVATRNVRRSWPGVNSGHIVRHNK